MKESKNHYSAEALKQIQAIDDQLGETEYKLRSQCAIDVLTTKLANINAELSEKKDRTVISQVSSRVKTAESIYEKLKKRGLPTDFKTAQENLTDLIGVRVVCPFEDEVYEVADCLEAQDDIETIEIKDYIKTPKNSGYKSLHLILGIPVYLGKEYEKEIVEVQIRTMAMDYWSVLEYQLFYKKKVASSAKIAAELKQYAEDIAWLDERMLKLRDKIEEI